MSEAMVREKGLLNYAQAALLLDVSTKRVSELVRTGNLDFALLKPIAVPLDMASTPPSVIPAAVANFCACTRASAIRSAMEQTCDCCNGADTCVPCTVNVWGAAPVF